MASRGEDHLGRSLLEAIGLRRPSDWRPDALALLAELGLEQKAGDLAEELSFGEQKLLTLARLLGTGPSLLLLDEPASGVSSSVLERILDRLRREAAAGRSILVIEHDLDLVSSVCDQVLLMSRGRITDFGTTCDVLGGEAIVDAYHGD